MDLHITFEVWYPEKGWVDLHITFEKVGRILEVGGGSFPIFGGMLRIPGFSYC